ncbi:hypothetical protein [Streptomyces sp. NPDC057694]|uniref:hypothetical protein n=1 Tax=unclassified Streptomyces TaxID=2593676 RepID=UPI00367ABEA5
MASVTHTGTRILEQRRAVADRSPAPAVDTTTLAGAPGVNHDWPDATQVWNWSATAVMGGYGPSASAFV